MNRTIRTTVLPVTLSLLLAISLVLCGCSSPSVPTNGNAGFRQFTQTLFQQDVASNTISLHYTLQNPADYGIEHTPVTYGSFGTDTANKLSVLENCLAALSSYDYEALSAENKLTYDVLKAYLETEIDGAPYALYEEPLGEMTGIQAQLPVLLAEYQFYKTADVDTYLALLATTPDYFDSLIAFERKKAENGLFLADSTLDAVVRQCRAFARMGDDNYLLSTFEERIAGLEQLDEAQKEAYIQKNRSAIEDFVIPAYENLIRALEALRGKGTNTQGVCHFPEGKAYYEYLVRRDTGSARSVPEIRRLIKNQIATDLSDTRRLLAGHPKLPKENSRTLFAGASPALLLETLEQKCQKAFPKPPRTPSRIKYVPREMEPYLSPAFYMIPAIDNTSENVIYINRSRNIEPVRLFTTLAHEGYPGHLYQTAFFAKQNKNPIRTVLNFGGYVEGWATYAEMCSYYLTPLPPEQAAFLQKNGSLILGLYALSDIGIHYDGWSLADTARFFSDYGITDSGAVRDIYGLILSSPGNYLKYYVGYLEFLELKKEAQRLQGERFSQKSFHRAVLDVGPAPFSVVRKYVLGE